MDGLEYVLRLEFESLSTDLSSFSTFSDLLSNFLSFGVINEGFREEGFDYCFGVVGLGVGL